MLLHVRYSAVRIHFPEDCTLLLHVRAEDYVQVPDTEVRGKLVVVIISVLGARKRVVVTLPNNSITAEVGVRRVLITVSAVTL